MVVEPLDSPDPRDDWSIELRLSGVEVALIRTALKLLESTLGREEADELAEVKALLGELPPVPEGDASRF
ncbi:MAG: hypothetical protein A2X23_09265 [Chloroflexi bacterium GWC2_73_18]|nr:MAG: hypothetical protein A2X23_09265 [Chloroflexi bacterium GWC2_73_18]